MPDSTSPSATSLPEPDLTGRTLGDYCILRKIGQGGMALVYLAEQQSLKRQVAFKVLRQSLAGDHKYVQRFHHEAQAAAKLVHANIVQTHEVGCIDGIHFIAQEYVPGQNLRQLLKKQGSLEVPQAVQILMQVAFALQAAAEQGVIHRDIKPENTLIAPRGEVKVADFGLARVMIEGRQVELTQVGMTMGTPLYMSPEQIEGKRVDPRSDIYSLGVMAYHMLAGHPPFEADSPLSIAVQHLHEPPKPLDEIRRDIPARLVAIVHRMLEKNPDQRYASPAELIADLRQLTSEGGTDEWQGNWTQLMPAETASMAATRRLEAAMQNRTTMIRQQRRKWLTIVVAGLVAFAIGAGAARLFRPEPLLPSELTQTTAIPKQATPREQLYFAIEQNVPQAYRAVSLYFPPSESPLNEHYGRLARRYLAEYYSENAQWTEAQREYEQLAALGESSPQFTVIGLFGQANILHRQKKRLAATSKLTQASRWWSKIPADQQAALLESLDPDLRPAFLAQVRERATTGTSSSIGTEPFPFADPFGTFSPLGSG